MHNIPFVGLPHPTLECDARCHLSESRLPCALPSLARYLTLPRSTVATGQRLSPHEATGRCGGPASQQTRGSRLPYKKRCLPRMQGSDTMAGACIDAGWRGSGLELSEVPGTYVLRNTQLAYQAARSDGGRDASSQCRLRWRWRVRGCA